MKTKNFNSIHSLSRAVFAGAALLLAVINSETAAQAQYNYTILRVPGATNTYAQGISSNLVVGYYQGPSGEFGYLYNISSNTYTTLNLPGLPYGISGNNIVGVGGGGLGGPQSFVYNISSGTYTTLPKMNGYFNVTAASISGNNVVGSVPGTVPEISFIYSTSSGNFTMLNAPGAQETIATGISGNTVVGYYEGTSNSGFLYNGGTYTPVNSISNPNAISGNNILGGDVLYNMSTGTSTIVSVAGTGFTTAEGVDGNRVVGSYYSSGINYGFLATPGPPKVVYLPVRGHVQVGISGPFNSAIVQESSDMLNWVNVYTNTPPFTFTDSAAAVFPCRFYRAALSQ